MWHFVLRPLGAKILCQGNNIIGPNDLNSGAIALSILLLWVQIFHFFIFCDMAEPESTEQRSGLLKVEDGTNVVTKEIQQTNSSSPSTIEFLKFVLGKQILLAFVIGLSLTLACFGFTYWLSLQNLTCPSWALECTAMTFVANPLSDLPLIQGIISLVHGLGLTCLFFVATTIAEPTLWPLLSRNSYTLISIDVYLQGMRGSLPSIIGALFQVRDHFATVVLLCLALIAVLSQLDRAIIGQVYMLQNTTQTYQSEYQKGGGIGISIPASNSNGPLADPAINGFAYYTSWSKGLSIEPMPDLREFLVDRYNLSSLDSFTIFGLKAQKSVNCSGRPLTILEDYSAILNVTAKPSDTSVWIRTDPRLSCWIDSSEMLSNMTSITTIMFAATDGSVEGGSTINHLGHNITSLQCDVRTELVQSTYQAGSGGPQITTLSNASFHSPGNNITELANWLGGAATTFGIKVYNARPMFGVGLTNSDHGEIDPTKLPQGYTTIYAPDGNGWEINDWSQTALKNFINVTSGAVGLAMSMQMTDGPVIIHSVSSFPKLNTAKTFLLLLPTGIILLIIACLAAVNRWSHNVTRIQKIRLARIPEWTESLHGSGKAKNSNGLVDSSDESVKDVRYRLQKEDHEAWHLEMD
ncbi:hypothetical protein EYC80_007437 [Monilinia laxa]|uniref:Uncharacterized protein n=1 Tax=Monilinia laxa TaxID=61186 RepID=A0A5N6JUP4_MONLA|nr:hypothetical protein EYC80_007437 [Monilinia laxa]